jgi:CheY-like chemotaxis protein
VLSVRERVDAFRTMLASSIGGKVKLVASVGTDVWPVRVDPSELELALLNLALNARDAMPDGGVIAVSAENVTLSRTDTDAEIEGEFVALRINDTGTGIPPDILSKVFDPFFTTKQINKGSGLGLSQVHGFVHQSGGTVTIDSTLGRGTTVTLYLPRAVATAEKDNEESETEGATGGTVLVVEDNPDVSEVTVSMLTQLGYEVHAVPDAAAALQQIADQDYDLVVSDVVMAGAMDGVALARAIRQRKPSLPVLLVTGYSQVAAAAGTEFMLLRKPFQIADLSRVAARMIAEAKQPPTANVVRLRDARPGPAAKSEES